MAATWDEIKRLAADFQKAQLSSTTQKLSERNCHEIVSRLIGLKLINVIYTCDGKSYLTLEELEKEILEEVDVHQGRVNLVQIQHSLNVDMHHLEGKAQKMIAAHEDLQFVLGQIINASYLDQMCIDINDTLQSKGQISFAELSAKTYDLPRDFIVKEVIKRIGVFVFGRVDPQNKDVLYTDAYVNRHRCKLQGILSAVTRPTVVSSLATKYHIPEKLFHTLLGELLASGRLKGNLSPNKTVYTPHIYALAQTAWIHNFYTQNGFIEYDMLSRLGISDPKGWCKMKYSSAVSLSTCCVSEATIEGLKVAIEDTISNDSWTDAASHLPEVLSQSDVSQIASKCLVAHRTAVVLDDTVVTTNSYLNKFLDAFDSAMQLKATTDLKQNAAVFKAVSVGRGMAASGGGDDEPHSRKDEKKRAKGGSKATGGAGSQGREVKSKSVKNKYKGRGGHDSDDDDSGHVSASSKQILEFMSEEDIATFLSKIRSLEDASTGMIDDIASRLYRPLRDRYQTVARDVYEQSSGSVDESGGKSRKNNQVQMEENINTLYANMKMFERAVMLFPAEETQDNVTAYLLKTVCTELLNVVLTSLAAEHMITVPEKALENTENRGKVIAQLPAGLKDVVNKVHTALRGTSIDGFDMAFCDLLSPKHVGVFLKKVDKKKEKQLITNHRMALLDQLEKEQDPASTFHLAVVLLFNAIHQTMLHCPGRLIPTVITKLRSDLTAEHAYKLSHCQDLIIRQVKGDIQKDDEDLVTAMNEVKQIAFSVKKAAT